MTETFPVMFTESDALKINATELMETQKLKPKRTQRYPF